MGSYPTYEEWKRNLKGDKGEYITVLILPMRNGNILSLLISLSVTCSYPTYEEWKLIW